MFLIGCFMLQKRGFTLVELAIVMTIIGLLIGGILKGQELLENARVTSTIAQVKSYQAAILGFEDVYGSLPGDLPDAGNKIPGCNANCTPVASDSRGAAGDGKVGFLDVTPMVDSPLAMNVPPSSSGDETFLFWLHLLKANFITGVTGEALTPSGSTLGYQAGVTHPAAKLGGLFFVTHADGGVPLYGGHVAPWPIYNGLQLFFGATVPTVDGLGEGEFALTPGVAGQIDRKMDDGMWYSGSIYLPGNSDGRCISDDEAEYRATSTTKICRLAYAL